MFVVDLLVILETFWRPKVLYNVKNAKFGEVNVKQTQIKVSRTDVLLEISFDVSRNYLQQLSTFIRKNRVGWRQGWKLKWWTWWQNNQLIAGKERIAMKTKATIFSISSHYLFFWWWITEVLSTFSRWKQFFMINYLSKLPVVREGKPSIWQKLWKWNIGFIFEFSVMLWSRFRKCSHYQIPFPSAFSIAFSILFLSMHNLLK